MSLTGLKRSTSLFGTTHSEAENRLCLRPVSATHLTLGEAIAVHQPLRRRLVLSGFPLAPIKPPLDQRPAAKRCPRLRPCRAPPLDPRHIPAAVARSVSANAFSWPLCHLHSCFFGHFYEIALQALPDDLSRAASAIHWSLGLDPTSPWGPSRAPSGEGFRSSIWSSSFVWEGQCSASPPQRCIIAGMPSPNTLNAKQEAFCRGLAEG